MAKELTPDFLGSLQSQYQKVRDHRVGLLFNVAGSAGLDAETRRQYLDAALALDPHVAATALHDIMCSDTTTSDRRSAARLYLYGGNMGWWKIPAPAADRARALLAPRKKDQPMNPRTTPTKAPKARNTTTRAERNRMLAVGQAGARVEALLKDPAATESAKIDAIDRWFRLAEEVFPDEFKAAMQGAWKTAFGDHKITATTTITIGD